MRRQGQDGRESSQVLRFCRSYGGVRIAYAVHGSGPPLVMAPSWFSHLERMPDLVDFDLNIALGDVNDDVRDLLRGFGFEVYTPLAEARR